jgi:hypothetical protein
MVYGCNVTYPNEVACLEMNVAPCGNATPLFYHVHFRTEDETAHRLHDCISKYIAQCQVHCSDCLEYALGAPTEIKELGWRYVSSINPMRVWEFMMGNRNGLQERSVSLVASYGSSIVGHCEQLASAEEEKLTYGLSIGLPLLAVAGVVATIAYCKYKERTVRVEAKVPLKEDDDLEVDTIKEHV